MIERASSADLAFLAMDTGRVPQQFAVILLLDRSDDFSLSHLRQLVSDRILAVPRLRQRLIKVPPGCGRSVWVDDADFNIDRHVQVVSCRAPGDEPALYDTALSVIMDPLPRDAPLWLIVLITDLADGTAAVVVVLPNVSGEILINRSVEQVFDFVADQRNEPIYNPRMLRSEKITDGPIGVGTRNVRAATSRDVHRGNRLGVWSTT